MKRKTWTASQWPGPPRELPELMPYDQRFTDYPDAARDDSTEVMWRVFLDLGQRLAAPKGESDEGL